MHFPVNASSNNEMSTEPPPDPQVALSTATITLPPTPTEILITPTLTQISPLNGQVKVVSLNLREGPGTIHDILGNYPNGTGIVIMSQTPNGEWVKVKTNDDKTGWMYRSLLKIDGDWQTLPVEENQEDLMVTGKIVDSTGLPINDITIACLQIVNEVEKRTDAVSGTDGSFYAYLPSNSTGIWSVQVVGVGCGSSIASDACDYSGYFENYGQELVEIPQIEPIVFIYQE